VVALVGPTASGKSALALAVAEACGSGGAAGPVELVSVDSMAVYRGMDIGTAKPTPEVRSRVAYHLVDLVDASETFTVQQFQACARSALEAIAGRRHLALLVGGTGLHLRAVVDDLTFPGRFPEVADQLSLQLDSAGAPDSPGEGAALDRLHHRLATLDPVAAGRIEPGNRRRLVRALEVSIGSGRPFSSFGPGLEAYPPTFIQLVGIRCDPEETDRRIAERVEAMMAAGLLDEVERLRRAPGGLSRTARQALGYRELLAHLEEGQPLAEAVDQVIRRTRTFARRQWAWFRRDPRIVWLTPEEDPVATIVGLLHGPVRD
jgi:tRNA dimethylallyltransferase